MLPITVEYKSEYQAYHDAKRRCNNTSHIQYPNYGGRGIKFLFQSFTVFLQEVGRKPKGYCLDRINNDGHYEIGNVKWSTRKEQGQNKRIYKTNKFNLSGVTQINPTGPYKTVRFLARTSTTPRKELYKGPDFFEACCARKSWENQYV